MFNAFQNNNTNPAPSGGLFGSTNTQQQSQPSGGLFGNLAAPQNQNTTQPTAPTLFGNSNLNTTQAPSLFGGSTTAPNQNTTGGGLFGGQQQTNTTGATGGGLFGGGQTTSNTDGGGLFGNKPAGSLFGAQPSLNINTNTTNNGANTNSTSLFGGLGQQQQQQPQQQQSNFFSQPSQQQQQQQQQQQKPLGSIFGGLGQSTSTSTSNTLFGGGGNTSTLNTSTLGGSTLGGTFNSNTLLSSRTPAPPSQQQPDAQAQFAKLTQRIETIARSWDSNSSDCRFQHYFYNLVDPNQVNLYGRPPNATNENLWQKAVRENPDPSCLVPVLAVGFDDLRQRVDAQSQQATAHQEKLKELKTRLESLSQRHAMSNSSRLLRASSQQTQLTHRLLAFIQHLHLLIPTLRSSSIRPEEEQLRGRLEEIEEEVRRGRAHGRLNELWALLGAVNAARERGNGVGGGGWATGRTEWAVVDEEGLGQITQILSEQQTGLAHLTKILQGNLKDLSVIMGEGGYREGKGEEESYGVENSWGTTSMLRASALR